MLGALSKMASPAPSSDGKEGVVNAAQAEVKAQKVWKKSGISGASTGQLKPAGEPNN